MTGIFLFFLFLNFLPWPAKAVEISNFNLSPGCDNKTDNPVNCVPGQTVIEARWTALDNALCPTVSENKCYYRILRKESSSTGSFVTLASNLTYISGASAVWRDTGGGAYPLKERTNYTYKIEARDASGGTIYGTSGEKETMSKVCGCPLPFVLYGASNDCDGNISQIRLSWQETAILVLDGSGISVLAPHYGIYRWNGPCSSSSCYDPSNAVGFIDRAIACQAGKCFFVDGNNSAKRLEFNKAYYYKVVAYSEGAERASANQSTPVAAYCPKSVIPSNSATPPGLELGCSPLQLKLRWDDCAGATNPAACQQSRLNTPVVYYIYKDTNENGYIWINSLPINSSPSPCQWQSNKFSCQFNDSKVKSNFSYSYYVKAAGQGWTLDSNYSELLTIGGCAVQINPPDYLWVTPFCDSLDNDKPKMTLSWGYTADPPANIRRYYIYKYRCTNPPTCSSWQAITKDGATTYYDSYNTTAEDVIWVDGSQSYHTVIAGETYYYKVTVETTAGVSNPTPPSTSVKAREDCISPPRTATPVLTLGDSCSNLAPVMILNWTPPKTDGNGDGNSDGTTDDIFVYHILRNGVLYTDTANLDSYIDTFNVSPGQPYYYQIIADGPGGPAASNLTPTVFSRDDCNKPTPFKLITAAKSCLPPSQHQVYLDWQNSSNLSRYEVFRKATNSPPDCTTSEGRLSAGLITNLNITSLTDTENLVEGATYYYFIRASVDGGSCTLATLASGVSNAVTIPYATPSQPSGLTATPQCLNGWQSSLRITWTVDPAVASYKLCYNTSPAVTEANCTQSLLSTGSYDFANVTVGQNYYFAIQADSGCAKSLSAVVGPTTARCCPPPSFSINGTATCQSTAAAQHTLSWTTNPSAESYEVFQSANNLDFSSLGLRSSPFDNLVGPNNTFYYFVRAKATCGLEYTNSNTFQLAINCLSPASPTLTLGSISCIGGYPAIAFSWSQSANATSYSIYRCQGTDCPPNIEIKSGYNWTSYNDIGGEGQAPLSGNLYSYQIKAINANGNSFNLSNSLQNILAPYCPPAPFILSSATNCDPVANRPIFKLKWTKAAEPATLDKYKIYRVKSFITSRGPSDPVVAEKAGTFFDQWWTDDTFPPGEPINDQNYSYYVEAVAKNNAGSSYSNIVNLKKDCQGPTGTLTLTANASCNANNDPYVDLDWTMSNLTDVASYKLYKGGQLIYTDTTISATETYPDSNIESGSSYNYAVRACDQNNLCTSDSAVNNVSVPYCPVGIPSDLQVGAICQAIDLPAVNLNWQPAKNATQYTIVRKIGGVINKTYSVTATSKSDNEVVGGTTYTYQIIAKNPANLCATNDCAVCAGQCSTVQTASVPTCGVSEPVLSADKYCSGEGVPADLKCFNQGDQYGTYTHLCWTADDSLGAPIWCWLERQTPEGVWLVKTPTFHSQGNYNHTGGNAGFVDNISGPEQNYTNRAFLSATSKIPDYSVGLTASNLTVTPSRIALSPGIYPFGLYPAASQDLTLDFWFRIDPYTCATNRDQFFKSFLWKDSGNQAQPDFRIAYNNLNNNGYKDSLVMLKSDLRPFEVSESERATLINDPDPVTLEGGLTCDAWHHFLWTQDQTSGQTQVYLDKTLAYNGLWGNVFTRNKPLYFGCSNFYYPGTTTFFRVPQTLFDEIKIWPDKIINSRQVQKLYDIDSLPEDAKSLSQTNDNQSFPGSQTSADSRSFYLNGREFSQTEVAGTGEAASVKLARSFWTISAVDQPNDVGQYSSIAAPDANNIFISYFDATNYDLKFAKSTDAGVSWTISAVHLSTNDVGRYSSIAAPDANNIFISYHDATNYDLNFAKSTNAGVSWTISAVDPAGYVGAYSSVTTPDANNIFISYYNFGVYNLKFAKSTNAGNAGSWTISAVDQPNDVGAYSSVTTPDANNIFISYLDATNGDLKFAKSTNAGNAGSWIISTLDSADYVGHYTSIAAPDANNIFISYFDATNSYLKFAKSTNAGLSWTISTADSTFNVGHYTSIAAPDANNIFISYHDATNYDLKFAKSTNAGVSWTVSAVNQLNDVGQYSSIAAPDANNIFISYFDATNYDLKFAKYRCCDQVFYSSGLYTSGAIDNGDNSSWGNLSWIQGGGGTITLKARSDADGDFSDAPTWASCSNITNGSALSTGACVTNDHRYIQYQANLSTADTSLTPFLNEIRIDSRLQREYEIVYDDFETIEGGQYNYKVTCYYSGGATRTTSGNFTFPWCQPDIDFPQTNDLQSVCSDWADKNIVANQTADCSGGYSDDTEEIAESSYQPQAPYALLAWDYFGAAETIEIKRYKEGETESQAITLATFSVDPVDPNDSGSDIQCPEGHCYCQDRSVQEADLSQKFHYFIKAIGPPPNRKEAKLYFPSADPTLSKSFGLTCSNDYGTEKFLLLNPCQAGQPTVKIVLKPNSGPAANIKSYWEGNAEVLTISQGLRSVTKEGVALSEDMAGNDDSATQLNATGFANPYGAVSWAALGNISTDPNLPQEPIALSMWVKFDSAYQAEKEVLFYGLNPASVWCEGCGDEPQEYLRLSRSGTKLTAADEGELEIASRASTSVDKRYYTDYILSDTTSWHHLKGVWQNDGANKKMKFWLDFNFIGETTVDTSFPIPATSGYNIYLGDHYKNSDTSPLTHNSLTAKAKVDEVYISKDSGNDPYYYEIFRKAPSEQTYRHLVTLDSNAYQWFERELTAESEYAYKVRLIPTDQNKLSLTLATFENTPDNIILPADCRPEYGPFDFQALSSSCLASQPVINLSWQDNKAPAAENNYILLADLPSGVVYIHIPPANCTQNSPNEPYQCHYVYQLPAETDYFSEHMFYLSRGAEEDEIANGAPVAFLIPLAEPVRPARCFSQPPTAFNLSGNACCAENGLCASNGPEPAVFLNWQDAQYTNYYEIYRCQLGVSLCSNLDNFIKMGSVEETAVCLNADSQTGSFCRFDWECGSGTCGETSYNLTDDQVEAGATYVYRIFAYGNGSQEANNSLIVITPSFGNEAGNCKLKPATPFITKIERGCTALDEPFHRLWWDYANQYGTEVAPSGDPNPNIIIDYWLIERQPQNGSFDLVKQFYPTNLPLPLVSTNFTTPFNNNLVSGHLYYYGVKAVTQVDSESFESFPSPAVEAMAPFCTDPPKNDIFNFGIDEYSSCQKISFKFETAADDFAEGYEIYQLANLPSLAKFNYQNCQYNYSNFSQGELKCSYSSSCGCAGVGSACNFCKNKKLNDQGLLIKEIIQARGPTTYTFEAENFAQNTTLYWAVVPFNSRGYYDSIEGSNIIPIQTNLCAQAPISSTFTAVSKCPSTVELKWKNPDESIYGYKIYRKKLEESDASYLLLADKDADSNEVKEACDIPNKSSCFNLYQDELSQALTEIYKYKIVSVSQQFIESEGRTYLIEGEAINKNARACFRLPRWQELPGIAP